MLHRREIDSSGGCPVASELRDPNSEDFNSQLKIEEMLGNAGIDPAREVVVYGRRGSTTPHFARYLLTYFGQMNQRLRELARRVEELEKQQQQQDKPATCVNC